MSEDISSEEAFVRCVSALGEELVLFARRMLDRPDQAQDVLQSALATAWKQRQSFRSGTNFRAWMYRYVLHEIQNENRRSSRSQARTLPSSDSVPDDDFWATLDSEAAYRELLSDPAKLLDRLDQELAGALRGLGESERLVLILRAVGEFTCGEIAEILRAPKGTVMAQLFRARSKLRRALGQSSRFSSCSAERRKP